MNTYFTITAQNIMVLRGVCYNTARKEWKQILDALGVKTLMLRQLAEYWGVPAQELAEALYYPARKLAA